jgi:hypothetical protein
MGERKKERKNIYPLTKTRNDELDVKKYISVFYAVCRTGEG